MDTPVEVSTLEIANDGDLVVRPSLSARSKRHICQSDLIAELLEHVTEGAIGN
jgi:hypothetical protein